MTEVPPLSYIEAFERRDYMDALHDEALRQRWDGEGHRLAGAFLALAQGYLDHASGNASEARQALSDARELAAKEEGFKADALVQHVDQCLEYMGMGKELPRLPSHF